MRELDEQSRPAAADRRAGGDGRLPELQPRRHGRGAAPARHLKHAGLATFLDRDQLPAGQPWLTALEQGIARCGAVAVLVGPAGLGTWQQREVQLALDRQAEAGAPAAPSRSSRSSCPRSSDPPGGFLRCRPGSTSAPTSTTPPSSTCCSRASAASPSPAPHLREALCPYRGLLAFREEDAGLFFGREARGRRAWSSKVRHEPLLTLVGRSGSGKSSVVQAGLIPALRRRADGRSWAVVSLRPGDEPLHALVRAFDPPPADLPPFEADQRDRATRSTILRTDADALADRIRGLLATAEERGTDRLLLYVDQWEELYTQALRHPGLDPEQAERRRRPIHRPPARRHPHQPLHGRPDRPRRLLRRPPAARAARRRRAAGPGQSRSAEPRRTSPAPSASRPRRSASPSTRRCSRRC